MLNWWDADEWADKRAMDFGKAPKPCAHRRVALTTEPVMKKNKHGVPSLQLVNRHPHERLRIFVGRRVTA